MRAITVGQPWASLLALSQGRHIETRSHGTGHRGPLAIHAAAAMPPAAIEFAAALHDADVLAPLPQHLPRGAVIAVAQLVDCRPLAELAAPLEAWDLGGYPADRHAWVLADVRGLPRPVPCRGQAGLWQLPSAVAAMVQALVR